MNKWINKYRPENMSRKESEGSTSLLRDYVGQVFQTVRQNWEFLDATNVKFFKFQSKNVPKQVAIKMNCIYMHISSHADI